MPDIMPVLTSFENVIWPCIRDWIASGPSSNSTSARNTTVVKTSKEIAEVRFLEDGRRELGARLIRRYDARLTKCVVRFNQFKRSMIEIALLAYSPGSRANILGNVLPIQNGIWNWEIVRSVYIKLVGRPKRFDTARLNRHKPIAFELASTRRTEQNDPSVEFEPIWLQS